MGLKKTKSKVPENDPTTESDTNSETEEEEKPQKININDIKCDTYVIVIFENRYYPGIVKEIKKNRALVSVMIKTK